MFAIFKKEINSFFNSLVGYLSIAVFLLLTGLFTWVFPETNVLEYGLADLSTLFAIGPYVLLFLIPAITMRSLAEEKKSGTMEWLLTKPIREIDLLIGKYFAALALIFISIAPTFIYYLSLYLLGSPIGNIDTAGVIGSYIGLFLLGAVFASIGLFSSSLTTNQVVAFIITTLLCFSVYEGLSFIASIDRLVPYAYIIESWGIAYHYAIMSKGLIDSRNAIYFLSIIFLMLAITHFRIQHRK